MEKQQQQNRQINYQKVSDIFIRYIIGWVYQDSQPLFPSALKGNSKFEIVIVKIFSLKQKKQQNQIISATLEKIVYGSFK